MREGGGAIYHAHTPQVVLPAPPLFSSLSPLSSVLFTYNLCRGRTILLFPPLDFLSSCVSLLALLCLTSGRLCPLMLSQWTLVLLMWDNGTHLKGYRALRTVSIRTPSSLFPLI